MWVKLTQGEIAIKKRQAFTNRLKPAVLIGIVVFIISLFKYTKAEYFEHGEFLVPWRDILCRLPKAMFYGMAMTFLWLIFCGGGKRTLICPKCGKSKFEDNVVDCVCGGHFENLDEMKWQGHNHGKSP